MNIIERYDINRIFSKHLHHLKGFKIVCICDDSTSMREKLNKGQTKWDELEQSIEHVLNIANEYDVECDVLFLNRPGFRKVESIRQLNEQFSSLPQGLTPLTNSFKLAIENNREELGEKKLLIIIFTDGCPTTNDYTGKLDPVKEFKEALQQRNPMNRIFVTIVACTDDEYSLRYLNNWDNTIPNLDVVDDYESEKKEIYAAGKLNSTFTYGDYIAKILLGSFVKEIDELDEKPNNLNLNNASDPMFFLIIFILIVFFYNIFNK